MKRHISKLLIVMLLFGSMSFGYGFADDNDTITVQDEVSNNIEKSNGEEAVDSDQINEGDELIQPDESVQSEESSNDSLVNAKENVILDSTSEVATSEEVVDNSEEVTTEITEEAPEVDITVNFTVDGKSITADWIKEVWATEYKAVDKPTTGASYVSIFVKQDDTVSCYGQAIEIKEGINNIDFDSSNNVQTEIIYNTNREYSKVIATLDTFGRDPYNVDLDLFGVKFINYPKNLDSNYLYIMLIGDEGSFSVEKSFDYDTEANKIEDIVINDNVSITSFHCVGELGKSRVDIHDMFRAYNEIGDKLYVLSDIIIKIFSGDKCIIEGNEDSNEFKNAVLNLPTGNYDIEADYSSLGFGVQKSTFSVGERLAFKAHNIYNNTLKDINYLWVYVNGEFCSYREADENMFVVSSKSFLGSNWDKYRDFYINGENEIVIVDGGATTMDEDSILYREKIELDSNGYASIKVEDKGSQNDSLVKITDIIYLNENMSYTLDGEPYNETDGISYNHLVRDYNDEIIDTISLSGPVLGENLITRKLIKDNEHIKIFKKVMIDKAGVIDLETNDLLEIIPHLNKSSSNINDYQTEYDGYNNRDWLSTSSKNLISNLDYSSIRASVRKNKHREWYLELNKSAAMNFDDSIVFDNEVTLKQGEKFNLKDSLNLRDGYDNCIMSLKVIGYDDKNDVISFTITGEDSAVRSYEMSLDDINYEIGNLPVGDYTIDLDLSPFELGLKGLAKLTITDEKEQTETSNVTILSTLKASSLDVTDKKAVLKLTAEDGTEVFSYSDITSTENPILFKFNEIKNQEYDMLCYLVPSDSQDNSFYESYPNASGVLNVKESGYFDDMVFDLDEQSVNDSEAKTFVDIDFEVKNYTADVADFKIDQANFTLVKNGIEYELGDRAIQSDDDIEYTYVIDNGVFPTKYVFTGTTKFTEDKVSLVFDASDMLDLSLGADPSIPEGSISIILNDSDNNDIKFDLPSTEYRVLVPNRDYESYDLHIGLSKDVVIFTHNNVLTPVGEGIREIKLDEFNNMTLPEFTEEIIKSEKINWYDAFNISNGHGDRIQSIWVQEDGEFNPAMVNFTVKEGLNIKRDGEFSAYSEVDNIFKDLSGGYYGFVLDLSKYGLYSGMVRKDVPMLVDDVEFKSKTEYVFPSENTFKLEDIIKTPLAIKSESLSIKIYEATDILKTNIISDNSVNIEVLEQPTENSNTYNYMISGAKELLKSYNDGQFMQDQEYIIEFYKDESLIASHSIYSTDKPVAIIGHIISSPDSEVYASSVWFPNYYDAYDKLDNLPNTDETVSVFDTNGKKVGVGKYLGGFIEFKLDDGKYDGMEDLRFEFDDTEVYIVNKYYMMSNFDIDFTTFNYKIQGATPDNDMLYYYLELNDNSIDLIESIELRKELKTVGNTTEVSSEPIYIYGDKATDKRIKVEIIRGTHPSIKIYMPKDILENGYYSLDVFLKEDGYYCRGFSHLYVLSDLEEMGDIVEDSKLNDDDINAVLNHIIDVERFNENRELTIADMNFDGEINAYDALLIYRKSQK